MKTDSTQGQALVKFLSYPVRPSVVIPDEMAEERVGQMVSQGMAQLLAEELHPERSTRVDHYV